MFRMIWLFLLGCISAGTLFAASAYGSTQSQFSPFLESLNIEHEQHALSILSAQDRQLYYRIFTAQHEADFVTARRLITQLNNTILMGYVTFQRLMHPTGYRSKFYELADWLDSYADYPEAKRVYRLARKRRPAGNTQKLRKPTQPAKISSNLRLIPGQESEKKTRTISSSKAANGILWQVKKNISEGWVTVTWKKLREPNWRKKLSDEEYVRALGDIAKGYVIHQVDDKAIAAAKEALRVDASYPSQAYWWGGLAAWRLRDFQTAAEFFTRLGSHPNAEADIASAASFWGWRAELRLGNITAAHHALMQGARDPYSFYGQLSRRVLNLPDGLDWQLSTEDAHAHALIMQYSQLRRILALSESGQYDLAQAEVMRLRYEDEPEYILALMYIADRAGMANFALNLGRKQRGLEGTQHDISRFPLPKWQLDKGYRIDRALLYAVILKESQFTTKIQSHAGAKGLMQIMPGTARLMQKRLKLPLGEYQDPALNLTLGQEYFKHLLTLPEIDFNLVYALAGYNAGPGRLKEWRLKFSAQDDPLLFIETIPVRETRLYVEAVLGNLWVYRKRLNQDTPSMTMLLEGKWPMYRRLDHAQVSLSTTEELPKDAY